MKRFTQVYTAGGIDTVTCRIMEISMKLRVNFFADMIEKSFKKYYW